MKLLKFFAVVLTILYPFLVYWGLGVFDSQLLLSMVFGLIALRWLVGSSQERIVLVATTVGVLSIVFCWEESVGLKFYPVLVNLGFLFVFASSLIAPPTVIERFARLTNKELSREIIDYTRKVTWVWCAFFVINALVSAYTAIWASDDQWMLYNGFVAYILIGCLFAVEWLVRQRMLRG